MVVGTPAAGHRYVHFGIDQQAWRYVLWVPVSLELYSPINNNFYSAKAQLSTYSSSEYIKGKITAAFQDHIEKVYMKCRQNPMRFSITYASLPIMLSFLQ
ncbi:hypothetical protein CEXT_232291 [Caerostris extrusa]|uniref:Uncharacterized protein n=1 Tax=Caerostris extrusa TaxID=172846 RepID=A0AAV4XVB7_CAEEX|nr:hypothetical protein CEXT_232291 [Caerostris extrusa]